ncbi:ATP-dependent DNA helicase [Trichonephila clavipes]|nr:ATP-dependent DNA helicase [Trichonephila clavipes]
MRINETDLAHDVLQYPLMFFVEKMAIKSMYLNVMKRLKSLSISRRRWIVTQIKENNVDKRWVPRSTRWVPPYNPVLSRTFNAHISVELSNSVKSIKYIYKATFSVEDQEEITRKKGKAASGYLDIKKDQVWGRIYTVHPGNAEYYYLRLFLHKIPGPTSFTALKIVAGITQTSFQEACRALGLLEDDAHWNSTLKEALISESA